MRQQGSSKTRVKPVFDALWKHGRGWLPALLALPQFGAPGARVGTDTDLALLEGYWGPGEKGLDPPVSLLSWLIRNLWTRNQSATAKDQRRKLLLDGDPETIRDALRLLRAEHRPRAWYVFEGHTYPDVFLVAKDAIVVIEGKRTEPGPETNTKWLPGRQQIGRHIDAAWELRGRRAVYGFFIVEGDVQDEGWSVPQVWRGAAADTVSADALRSSFPHRSGEEVQAIASCFLGVTTWRQVCERFDIDWRQLPRTVGDSAPGVDDKL